MIIYKTTNSVNGKIYIGKYCGVQSTYLGSGVYLKRAIKKYGKKNFFRETLEDGIIDHRHLCEREIYWIDFYDSTNLEIGYNLCKGGFGGSKTEEYKENNWIKSNKRARNYQRAWDNYCQYRVGKFLEEVLKNPETEAEEKIKEEYRKNICQTYGTYCQTHFKKPLEDVLFNFQTEKEERMKMQYCSMMYEIDDYIELDHKKDYTFKDDNYMSKEDVIKNLESSGQYMLAKQLYEER